MGKVDTGSSLVSGPTSVDVPTELAGLFCQAENVVSEYFRQLNRDPEKGVLEVWDERYLLIRGASLSVEFFNLARELFGEGREWEAHDFARNILYDLAHAIGKSDARNFHTKMQLDDPIAKLSAGPIHFSHTGWAFVRVLPESRPTADDDYYLIYDHPNSFETDSWIERGQQADFPVCVMNSGYSAGWCEQSFNMPLHTAEIQCRAKGDPQCRFIMAPPHRLEEHVVRYAESATEMSERYHLKTATDLFSRKRLEQDLRRSESLYRGICDSMFDGIFILGCQNEIVECNPSAGDLVGVKQSHLKGQNLDKFLDFSALQPGEVAAETASNGKSDCARSEAQLRRRDGKLLTVDVRTTELDYKGSKHILMVIRDITNRKKAEAELAEANAKLVENSRAAGKAEIATGVLHDVGNVLNSVNVSAYLVSDVIQNSVQTGLEKIIDQLKRHGGNLAKFLSENDRGMHLVTILSEVARETKTAADELKSLQENMDHVKVVIAAQQSFATLGAIEVKGNISDAITGAMKICQESVRRSQIDLKFQCHDFEASVPDKQKLIQILVNLINNAIQAVNQCEGSIREVTITQEKVGEMNEIRVLDSGIGISKENLVKIFQHGFSTRKSIGGHGFGLHHSANAAVEMGGQLQARSDGLGMGAEFTLTLPIC